MKQPDSHRKGVETGEGSKQEGEGISQRTYMYNPRTHNTVVMARAKAGWGLIEGRQRW